MSVGELVFNGAENAWQFDAHHDRIGQINDNAYQIVTSNYFPTDKP